MQQKYINIASSITSKFVGKMNGKNHSVILTEWWSDLNDISEKHTCAENKFLIIICSLLACSVLKLWQFNLWGFQETFFFYFLQNPLSYRTRISTKSSFPYPGCLPRLTSHVQPSCNPGKGPLPGATHRASGPWSSHKAGSLLPVVGVSFMSVPTLASKMNTLNLETIPNCVELSGSASGELV
jgi:hypothetical protein